MRDTRLAAPVSPLTVDASPNGGIRVEGWDQPDVLVRAVVYAYGDTDAEGPDRTSGERRSGWSVSFRESRFTTLGSSGPLLELRTVNGGVRINAR